MKSLTPRQRKLSACASVNVTKKRTVVGDGNTVATQWLFLFIDTPEVLKGKRGNDTCAIRS